MRRGSQVQWTIRWAVLVAGLLGGYYLWSERNLALWRLTQTVVSKDNPIYLHNGHVDMFDNDISPCAPSGCK